MAVALQGSSSRSSSDDSCLARRRGAPGRRLDRARLRAAAFLFGALGLFAVAEVGAMGLGAASLNSSLGEPLRLSFPVSSLPGDDIGCVQVRGKGDDLPSVINARTSVIHNGFQTRVEVRSAQPIDEPAIGLVVSVGCTSPISREYVVFLDPPVVAPLAPAADSAFAPSEPARASPRRPSIPRSQRAASESPRATGSGLARSSVPRAARPQNAPVRQSPRLKAAAPPAVAQVPSAAPSPPPAVAAAPAPMPTRDRLTVVPTETPPTIVAASPPLSASAGVVPPAVAPAATDGTQSVAAEAAEAAAAQERALRQQQADLQQQIKVLSDQIAALRVQTTSLVARNEVLERSSFSPLLIWLLIALAVLAIAVAGWTTWRYTQLRKSVEGSAWWTGNTTQGVDTGLSDAAPSRDGPFPLDAATRFPPRGGPQSEVRAPTTSVPHTAAVVSNVEPARPLARNARFTTAIDTDFTVSDIEAAMATVRTVSPPRDQPRPRAAADSDLASLSGLTLPAPYADAPTSKPTPMPRSGRDGDNPGKFVDLEIPPLPVPPARQGGESRPAVPVAAMPFDPAPQRPAANASLPEQTELAPLDFTLDVPQTFDPLATDSLKTTVIDRPEPPAAGALELSGAPTQLDFELPSASLFAPNRSGDSYSGDTSLRHGATALDDLFPQPGGPVIDTVVDLATNHGTPLSATEVDRLMATTIDVGPQIVVEGSTRARMARFADIMNEVDDAAAHDPLRAIALLRQFVLRDEDIPTLLWLRLFELYKAVDKKAVYEALAEHFARRYERPMTGWTQTLAERAPQTPLAAMGAIDREIESLWGREEGLERIRALLCGRDQDDAIVFNAVLQRDLLDAAKVFPRSDDSVVGQAGS